MIVSKLSDGLGNHLFQYAILRAISLKNNTGCVLDIPAFTEGSLRKFGLYHFNIDCTLTDNFKLPLLNKVMGYKLGISSFKFHYYTDKIWEFDDKLQQDKSDFIHLSGYWVELANVVSFLRFRKKSAAK